MFESAEPRPLRTIATETAPRLFSWRSAEWPRPTPSAQVAESPNGESRWNLWRVTHGGSRVYGGWRSLRPDLPPTGPRSGVRIRHRAAPGVYHLRPSSANRAGNADLLARPNGPCHRHTGWDVRPRTTKPAPVVALKTRELFGKRSTSQPTGIETCVENKGGGAHFGQIRLQAAPAVADSGHPRPISHVSPDRSAKWAFF